MKKILLVYPPFCTPASPPFSITNLYSFLKSNCDAEIEVLDLNIEFHKLKFGEYREYYKDTGKWDDYDSRTGEYKKLSSKTYSENNKKVVNGDKPEMFDEMLKLIEDKKADVVAFSIVYSSQAFYAYSLLKELKNTVIGGPAANEKLGSVAGKTLKNEMELLEHIEGKKIDHEKLNFDNYPDYSIYNLDDYFTPYPVIPLKTSSTCFYRKCTFCTHYLNTQYYEFPLEMIEKTVVASKQKHFFLIDDMVSKKRLLDISKMMKPLDVKWTCQLRPTKDLDADTLKTLKESGLTMILWGVESGNDRVLNLINKGTNRKDIAKVLTDSHAQGIKNVVYIIIGFPTETKEEFLDTISLLEENKESIDLVSSSLFGLQKDTMIYKDPEKFGISKVIETERTILGPIIKYEVKEGLSNEDANKLRKGYKNTIESINKYPKTMNFFREHMFCL